MKLKFSGAYIQENLPRNTHHGGSNNMGGKMIDKSMTEEVRKALEESIEKWKWNLALVQKNIDKKIKSKDSGFYIGRSRLKLGVKDCPLCKIFYVCSSGCPIWKSGHNECRNTPYFSVAIMVDEDEICSQELAEEIEAEIEFLESLRPKKKKNQEQY